MRLLTSAVVILLLTAGCSAGDEGPRGKRSGADPAERCPSLEEDAAVEEAPPSRRWFVLTFTAPVSDADLAWLRDHGFCVDRVLGDSTRLRGWLPGGADGTFLSDTSRLEAVDGLMRKGG